MKLFTSDYQSRRRRGYTLAEAMVASGLGLFVLTALLVGSVFTLRSFVAMFNYTDMDSKSCSTLDRISKDVRQASSLISYTNTVNTKALVFQGLNSAGSPITITYKWDSDSENVICSKTGEDDETYLTGCTDFEFSLFNQAPSPGYAFNTTADASQCKLVDLTWVCHRTILSQFDTEAIETAQIVLRN